MYWYFSFVECEDSTILGYNYDHVVVKASSEESTFSARNALIGSKSYWSASSDSSDQHMNVSIVSDEPVYIREVWLKMQHVTTFSAVYFDGTREVLQVKKVYVKYVNIHSSLLI